MPFIRIKPIECPSPEIFLTVDETTKFGLKPGDKVEIKAGSAVTHATLAVGQYENEISLRILKALGLPQVKGLRLRLEAPGKLQIGPLIGIMVSRSKKYKLPPYSSQDILLRSFSRYSINVQCLTYVFSPRDVNTVKQSISGYFLETAPDGTTHWKRHTFPVPDVVYDRILFRTFERKAQTKEISSFFLKNNNVEYFNPKFLNKWETYLILITNPELREYLPETRKYENPGKLIDFIENYKRVYLKPANGSLGKGIVRISLASKGYIYQYRDGKQPVEGIWKTFEELAAGLKKLITARVYIMQQGLDLQKFDGKVFDIRVLMQKDGHGMWTNSATVARIAPVGGIFPNVAAGGHPKGIENLWQELHHTDWSSSQTCYLTRQISLKAAQTLENSLGTFGEIGLDIGVDVNGIPRIIEINSKPSRKVFPPDQPHLKKVSIQLPIDFAACLAGFASDQGLSPS